MKKLEKYTRHYVCRSKWHVGNNIFIFYFTCIRNMRCIYHGAQATQIPHRILIFRMNIYFLPWMKLKGKWNCWNMLCMRYIIRCLCERDVRSHDIGDVLPQQLSIICNGAITSVLRQSAWQIKQQMQRYPTNIIENPLCIHGWIEAWAHRNTSRP